MSKRVKTKRIGSKKKALKKTTKKTVSRSKSNQVKLSNKIISRSEAIKIISLAKQAGKKIGFTSGVFDLLHKGHVDYLIKAKAECDLLFLGLNSDASVRKNKGDLRPIVSEKDRAAVIAALLSVDYVFIFDEKNNNENIGVLKPDFYIKASDYGKEKLSSAPLVEKYGGTIILIPMIKGQSSSNIIDRIVLAYGLPAITAPPKDFAFPLGKAAFIDRDGTINKEVDYLCDPEKFELLPNVIEGMKELESQGYRIVIVTNQPGIGLGYYEKSDFFKVNTRLLKAAGEAGVKISKIYYCPHSKADGCNCRKPAQGMILRAKEELNLDIEKSVFIGDMTSDIETGKRAGCKTVLMKTGKAGKDGLYDVKSDYVAGDLLKAAKQIARNAA